MERVVKYEDPSQYTVTYPIKQGSSFFHQEKISYSQPGKMWVIKTYDMTDNLLNIKYVK